MDVKRDTKEDQKPTELQENAVNVDDIKQLQEDNNNSELNQNKAPKFIKKKLTYNKFKKLVAKGGYTSSRLVAQSLGIDKATVTAWLATPYVMQAMNESITSYVADIQSSKDWKAKAYLLDKITPTEEKEQHIDLKQLIVINTTQ